VTHNCELIAVAIKCLKTQTESLFQWAKPNMMFTFVKKKSNYVEFASNKKKQPLRCWIAEKQLYAYLHLTDVSAEHICLVPPLFL